MQELSSNTRHSTVQAQPTVTVVTDTVGQSRHLWGQQVHCTYVHKNPLSLFICMKLFNSGRSKVNGEWYALTRLLQAVTDRIETDADP